MLVFLCWCWIGIQVYLSGPMALMFALLLVRIDDEEWTTPLWDWRIY